MIKVLHIAWSLRFGGIEKLVFDLMKVQKSQREIEATLLVGQRHGEFVKIFEENSLKAIDLGLKNGMDFRKSKLESAKEIMSQYQVIHFHSFNPLMAWAAIKSNKRILYTIHGGFGFGRKKRINDRVLDVLKAQFLKRSVNLISCNSFFTMGIAKSRFGLKNHSNLTVIYNGIDLQLKKESAANDIVDLHFKETIKTKFIIGTVSRFAGFKRIDRLILAFSKMKQKENCRLVLVGEGPLRKELEALAKKQRIDHLTYFTSYQENVSPFQKVMDVCVYPSENEPFGLVAVESLALGKQVLVFNDGGGLVEVVGSYSDKMIVSSIEELANNLDLLFEKRDEIDIDTSQIERYAEQFSIEKMGEAFKKAYTSICK